MSPRYEYFDDKAAATGLLQKLQSFTLTAEMKPADNFMFRIEYRGDFSNQDGAFVNDKAEPKKSQNSIIFGLLYNFSTK